MTLFWHTFAHPVYTVGPELGVRTRPPATAADALSEAPFSRQISLCVGTAGVEYGEHISQEVCPFTQKFSRVAEEADYAPRPAWEAVWDADPDDPDDEGSIEAVIPTTDGPALVDLMRMSEDEWDAYTRGSAIRRAGYGGLRRNVAIALGNWLARADEPDGEALGVLLGALESEHRVVAETAAWGLRRTQRPK